MNPFAKSVDIECPKRQGVTFDDVAGGEGRNTELRESSANTDARLRATTDLHEVTGRPATGEEDPWER